MSIVSHVPAIANIELVGVRPESAYPSRVEIDGALADAPWSLFEVPDDEAEPAGCWSADLGRGRCERRHPRDLGKWCAHCRDAYLADLADGRDWMGGTFEGRVVSGFFDSPESLALIRTLRPGLILDASTEAAGEPVAGLTMAEWIEGQSEAIRSHGSNLAHWLADKVAEIARDCRSLSAETPDQFDARSEVMLRDLALATSEGGAR